MVTMLCFGSLRLQLQMEKLASRHAITELMSWISLMENIIDEDQDKIMGAVGSEVVQNLLQKYKVQNNQAVSTCTLQAMLQSRQSLLHVSYLPHRSLIFCVFQGFRIDLTCKQLTVDFVNQSVLQISSQDVEGKRSDKTDFAEKLGAMNRRWQILQGLIAEKVTFQLQRSQESDGDNALTILVCLFFFFFIFNISVLISCILDSDIGRTSGKLARA